MELHPGDRVLMNDNYYILNAYRGKEWIVRSEPWMCCGTLVVLLVGKAGGYAVDGLTKVSAGADMRKEPEQK